jgi:endogenous inhibitor of DNA gyrase (YacG/DUF329 family)
MAKKGTGKKENKCKICGNKFLARCDRPGIFCSIQCQRKGRSKRIKNFIEFKCKECQTDVCRRLGAGGTFTYCSIKCMSISRGRGMSSSFHPKWRGGISQRSYLSRKLIQLKKNQIGKCEMCGSTHHLQGHHPSGYSEDPLFIQILCYECHAKQHTGLEKFIRRDYGKEK